MTATQTTEQTINWTELIVTDSDGESWGPLGDLVRSAPANLDNANIVNGAIKSWDGFFLSAPGEEPDWDTPRHPVNWDGFLAAYVTPEHVAAVAARVRAE